MRLGVLLSAALGFAISSGSPAGLATSILAPVIWLRQRSRVGAYICAATYYLAALRSLPIVSRNFFGPESGLLSGICLWIVAASVLTLPWLWAWTPFPVRLLWRCPIALLLTIVPPLGLIGWASPIAAAGLLFPAAGYAGLALTLCLPGFIFNSGDLGLIAVATIICAFHIGKPSTPQPPGNWQAINTTFGPAGHTQANLVREYEIGRKIQSRAGRSKARVVIFPEAVAASWTDKIFQSNSQIILVGVTEPKNKEFDFTAALGSLRCSPAQIPAVERVSYSNKLVVRGAQIGEFEQRVPIPIGMWKPFTHSGVPLNLSGPGTISIAGRRVAVIICYEQLIPWPVLTSFVERPSIIVAVSNNVWVSGTSIPQVEQTTMRAWAALFEVPALFAANS